MAEVHAVLYAAEDGGRGRGSGIDGRRCRCWLEGGRTVRRWSTAVQESMRPSSVCGLGQGPTGRPYPWQAAEPASSGVEAYVAKACCAFVHLVDDPIGTWPPPDRTSIKVGLAL